VSDEFALCRMRGALRVVRLKVLTESVGMCVVRQALRVAL